MPKININEYDLTKAGTGEYENFSVVVPGFVGDTYDESVFDENGIYECSSQTDFVNYVGKRAAEVITSKVQRDAVAPTISYIIKYNPNLVDDSAPIVDGNGIQFKSREAFLAAYNALLKGEYAWAPAAIADESTEEPEDESEDENQASTVSYGVYHSIANTTGRIGKLKDTNYTYQQVVINLDGQSVVAQYPTVDGTILDIQPVIAAEYDTYYVIETNNEGTNGLWLEDKVTHYGNQMAYELLGLGYTVLFKRMSENNTDAFIKYVYEAYDANNAENCVIKYDIFDNWDESKEVNYLKPEHSAAISELADPNFWECLRDKSTYDFRYLVTGLLTNNDGANSCILSIADHSAEVLLDDASIKDGRGDCIALIDLDCAAYEDKTQSQAITPLAKEAAKWASTYAAVFAPYVTYIMPEDTIYNNSTFPASFHYLACAANSDNNNYAEWYANAGYTRGVSKYTIQTTGCKLGEIAVQSLEPRFMLKVDKELKVDEEGNEVIPKEYIDVNTTVAINLIIKIKSAYYLWGNRTGKKLGTRGASDGDLVAQHFLNIRQLCTTIKKQVYTTCRRLTFDPNSDKLWTDFRSLLTPTLEAMKADQGIKDYKFVKDPTDRKALLKARIRIVPIEAVEDFDIGLYLEDSLEGAVVTES